MVTKFSPLGTFRLPHIYFKLFIQSIVAQNIKIYLDYSGELQISSLIEFLKTLSPTLVYVFISSNTKIIKVNNFHL